MSDSITIRRAYKYRLYRNDKRDVVLRQHIRIAGTIWNHALALQKRYYRLTGKYIALKKLKSHIAKLRTQTQRFAFWQPIGSQAVQDMLERLDNGYMRFFTGLAKRPPKYKKVRRRFSFTLKQSGWKLIRFNENEPLPNNKYRRARGIVEIQSEQYKFVQHRPMHGTVKTVMIKRDAADRLRVVQSRKDKKPHQTTIGARPPGIWHGCIFASRTHGVMPISSWRTNSASSTMCCTLKTSTSKA